MVVVFFGTPQFAVPTLRHLLDSPHRVCGVVTQPDRPRGRGQKITDAPVKALAVERGLPVFQPDPRRGVHRLDHVVDELLDLGRDVGDGGRRLMQHVSAVAQDRADHPTGRAAAKRCRTSSAVAA